MVFLGMPRYDVAIQTERKITMKNDYFENKMVSHMCLILRTQKSAVALGNEEMAKEYGDRFEGFMDALSCTLAGPYIAHLVTLANEKLEAEG